MLYKNYVAYVNSVAIRLNLVDDLALKTPSELIPQEVLSTENVGFSFQVKIMTIRSLMSDRQSILDIRIILNFLSIS